MTEPTVGDIAAAAKAAAPGSIRVGRYLVTYHGEFPYADGPTGPGEAVESPGTVGPAPTVEP